DGHLFFSKWPELDFRHGRINDDETATAAAASHSRVSAGTCMERDCLFSKTSARANYSPALFCGWRFRLVLLGADARIRARRTRSGGERLRDSEFGQWRRSITCR